MLLFLSTPHSPCLSSLIPPTFVVVPSIASVHTTNRIDDGDGEQVGITVGIGSIFLSNDILRLLGIYASKSKY